VKTEDLIDSVARRAGEAPPRSPSMVLAVCWSALVAAAVFAAAVGVVRPDLGSAIATPRFLLKYAVVLSLAGAAFVLLAESAYPEGPGWWARRILMLPAAVLGVALAFELATLPANAILPSLIGRNALGCLLYLPLLGLGPLVVLLATLRRSAPARPSLAGFAAGLLAGAIGAAAYAAYCPDDSPLFVAVWYGIAIGMVAVIGRAAGRSVARW